MDSMSEDGLSSHGGGSTRHSLEDPRLRAMYARTAMGRPSGAAAVEAAATAIASPSSSRDVFLNNGNNHNDSCDSDPRAQAAEAKAALEALATAARQRPPSLKRWNTGGSVGSNQVQQPGASGHKSMWGSKVWSFQM